MKKTVLLFFITIFAFAACSSDKKLGDDPLMDELAADNKYHYKNEDLGFSVDLPEEFIYYQTQRNDEEEYQAVEFFVPTSDREYPQDIQSYAKFLTMEIYPETSADDIVVLVGEKSHKFVIGEEEDTSYVANFWKEVPKDWEDKWSEEMRDDIKDSIKITK